MQHLQWFKILMYIALMSLFTVAVTSCDDRSSSSSSSYTRTDKEYYIDKGHYDLVIVDGCEYLVSNSDKSLTHKGDCSNPIHSQKQIVYVKDTSVSSKER